MNTDLIIVQYPESRLSKRLSFISRWIRFPNRNLGPSMFVTDIFVWVCKYKPVYYETFQTHYFPHTIIPDTLRFLIFQMLASRSASLSSIGVIISSNSHTLLQCVLTLFITLLRIRFLLDFDIIFFHNTPFTRIIIVLPRLFLTLMASSAFPSIVIYVFMYLNFSLHKQIPKC